MKTVTVKQIMAQKPCGYNGPDDEGNYTENRVRKLFGRRKKLTALQVLDLDIPIEDRLWVVLRPELLDDRIVRLFVCDCAQRALRRERKEGREPDELSWEAVRVARRFANGKATKEELVASYLAADSVIYTAAASPADFAAACAVYHDPRPAALSLVYSAASSAASSAACSAAYSAACSAAYSAAHSAASSAARSAAYSAAHYAARSAAHSAAHSAERKWLIARLRKRIEKEKGKHAG